MKVMVLIVGGCCDWRCVALLAARCNDAADDVAAVATDDDDDARRMWW